jgi:hypothetical protein
LAVNRPMAESPAANFDLVTFYERPADALSCTPPCPCCPYEHHHQLNGKTSGSGRGHRGHRTCTAAGQGRRGVSTRPPHQCSWPEAPQSRHTGGWGAPRGGAAASPTPSQQSAMEPPQQQQQPSSSSSSSSSSSISSSSSPAAAAAAAAAQQQQAQQRPSRAATCCSGRPLLGLHAAGVGHQQGPVVREQRRLDLLLALLVHVCGGRGQGRAGHAQGAARRQGQEQGRAARGGRLHQLIGTRCYAWGRVCSAPGRVPRHVQQPPCCIPADASLQGLTLLVEGDHGLGQRLPDGCGRGQRTGGSAHSMAANAASSCALWRTNGLRAATCHLCYTRACATPCRYTQAYPLPCALAAQHAAVPPAPARRPPAPAPALALTAHRRSARRVRRP